MPSIRLLIATSPILRDIVRAVSATRPGVEVVGDVAPDTDLVAAAKAYAADAVIVGEADTGAPAWERLLQSDPRLRVVSLAEGGRAGCLHVLVAHHTVLKDVSPEQLLDAILDTRGFGNGG